MLAAVAVALLALTVGRASGGPSLGGVTSQLESTPDLSGAVPDVPAPSVPDVSGAVPDVSGAVPDVSGAVPGATGAVPDVTDTPSVPSTRLPSTVRDAAPAAGGAPRSGSGTRPSTSHPSRAAPRVGPSRGSPSAHGSSVHAASVHRAARERHLRRDVHRLAGCLDALPPAEGRVLAVRAGVGRAAPASLSQAARRLGISTHRAAVLERSGLRRLRAVGRSGGCGQGTGGGSRGAVALGGGARSAIPQLEPTVVLASRETLTSTAELARRAAGASGRGSVAGASPTTLPESASGALKRAGVVATNGDGSSKAGAYLAALALLALLLVAFAVAWRRRNEPGAPRLAEQTGTAAVWWPPTADGPEAASPVGPGPIVASTATEAPPASADEAPADDAPAEPVAPAGIAPAEAAPAAPTSAAPAPARPVARSRRPAAVAAASLVSLGVALLRRRRR